MKTKNLISKFLCLSLSLIMLFSVVSCSKKESEEDERNTVSTLAPEVEDVLGSMPKGVGDGVAGDGVAGEDVIDMGGKELTMLTMVGYGGSWEYEEYPADGLDQNRYTRNQTFMEKYNCEMYVVSDDNMVDVLINSHAGGSNEFDMIFPHPTKDMVRLLTSNTLADLKTTKGLSIDKPWYNQAQVDAYETNGKIFILANDASLTGQGFYGIVYNRELYNQYGFTNSIADMVDNGTWTMEAMRVMLSEVTNDTNDEENKVYAISINESAADRWLYAMGTSILTKKSDGTFASGFSPTKLEKVFEAFDRLVNNSGNSVLIEANTNATLADSKTLSNFKTSKTMFLTWDIGSTYGHLHDIEFSRGYVPLPKLDENQKNYGVLCGSGFFGLPIMSENIYYSALWMEFNARWGYASFKPLFFEKILNGRLADFPEDARMLQLMHSLKTSDIGFSIDVTKFAKNVLNEVVIGSEDGVAKGSAAVWVVENKNKLNALANTANSIGK